MQTVTHYELVTVIYHDEPAFRVRYQRSDRLTEESALYSAGEVSMLLSLWKDGGLLGSFGIGTILAADARFIVCLE